VRLLVVELAGSLLGREACTWSLSWPCIALGETETTGPVVLISRKRYEGNLEAVCSLRASGGTSIVLYGGLAWPEDGEGKQAGGASRGFDRNGMRFNIDGPILLSFLRDQSAKRPCMDSTLITPNGWRKAATESLDAPKERLRETPLQDPGMGPNASDIIRSCMEGEELEDLCFNYTSLVETLSSNWCCEVLALDISSPQGPVWRCTHGRTRTRVSKTLLPKQPTNICRSSLFRTSDASLLVDITSILQSVL
jgi:hypothetical protein